MLGYRWYGWLSSPASNLQLSLNFISFSSILASFRTLVSADNQTRSVLLRLILWTGVLGMASCDVRIRVGGSVDIIWCWVLGLRVEVLSGGERRVIEHEASMFFLR